MCDLRAGDLVECVDADPVHVRSKRMPELGQVYRIETARRVGDGYSVRLVEIAPECHRGGPCSCNNCGWDSGRFRRWGRLKSDRLGLFRAMLKSDQCGAAGATRTIQEACSACALLGPEQAWAAR